MIQEIKHYISHTSSVKLFKNMLIFFSYTQLNKTTSCNIMQRVVFFDTKKTLQENKLCARIFQPLFIVYKNAHHKS